MISGGQRLALTASSSRLSLLRNCLLSTNARRILLSRSLYEVLGVSPEAEQADIKAAFIERSKKTHPDLVRYDTHVDDGHHLT